MFLNLYFLFFSFSLLGWKWNKSKVPANLRVFLLHSIIIIIRKKIRKKKVPREMRRKRKFILGPRENEQRSENKSENVLSIIRKFDSLFNTQHLLIILFIRLCKDIFLLFSWHSGFHFTHYHYRFVLVTKVLLSFDSDSD